MLFLMLVKFLSFSKLGGGLKIKHSSHPENCGKYSPMWLVGERCALYNQLVKGVDYEETKVKEYVLICCRIKQDSKPNRVFHKIV